MAEISDKDEVLFPELFNVDKEGRVRLVAGYSKESNNWTFPKYLADPVSFSDEVEERLLSPTGELPAPSEDRKGKQLGRGAQEAFFHFIRETHGVGQVLGECPVVRLFRVSGHEPYPAFFVYIEQLRE